MRVATATVTAGAGSVVPECFRWLTATGADAFEYLPAPVAVRDGDRSCPAHRWRLVRKYCWRDNVLTCVKDGSEAFAWQPVVYSVSLRG
jgi:hypothetical protein